MHCDPHSVSQGSSIQLHGIARSHHSRPAAVLLATLALLVCGPSPVVAQNDASDTEADELFVFAPDTPERLVQAAMLATGVDRPELGRGYLRKVLDRSLSDEQLLALRAAFGAGQFLTLNANPTLQPEAGELLKQVNEASRRNQPTDADLSSLVTRLAGQEQASIDAAMQLLSAGNRAVPALLAADPSGDDGRIADALLKKYPRQFRYGLLAALADADEATQVRILNLLAVTVDPEIGLTLVRYAFAADSAPVRSAAAQAVRRLLPDTPLPRTDVAAAELLLRSTEDLLTSAGQRFPDHLAADRDNRLAVMFGADPDANPSPYGHSLVQLAVQLSQDAALIRPSSPDVAAFQLAAQTAAGAWPAQWPATPLIDSESPESGNTAETGSPSVATQALEVTLQTQNAAATIGLLTRRDVQRALLSARTDLLAEAIASGDPRVRLLASAIVKTSGRAVAGTSLAGSVLKAAANGALRSEAIAIDSRPADARRVATVLQDLKFHATSATSGQRGFDAAASALNPSLILVHSNVQRWTLTPTVANLRADARTKLAPIIVYGDDADTASVTSLLATYPGVWFVAEPFSAESLAAGLELRAVAQPLLSDEERGAMANFAASLLDQPE